MSDAGSGTSGTNGTSNDGVLDAVGYAGSAVAALVIGVAAVGLCLSAPLYGGILGIVAVVIGLRSRKQLKNEPTLRGARLSLAGFLLGLGAAVLTLVPLLIPLILVVTAF